MPYAVVLCIEENKALNITRLWDLLAESSLSNEQIKFNYPPHVTLAVFDDAVELNGVVEKLAPLATRWKSLPLTFSDVRVSAIGWKRTSKLYPAHPANDLPLPLRYRLHR